MLCFPEEAQPNAAMERAQIARRFAVDAQQMQQWIDHGLPCELDGRVDPFVCSNWISWHRLDQAPALQRLWRQFAAHFRPFVHNQDHGRHIHWQRVQTLFLPDWVDSWRWYVPDIAGEFSWQHSTVTTHCHSPAATISQHSGCWEIQGHESRPQCTLGYDLHIEPYVALSPNDDDYAYLYELMCTVVESFCYEYRIHELNDHPSVYTQRGTCLDVALQAAALCGQQGRKWRICGGVIAHSALLNPHHWLEIECSAGWVPFDASIPAIMRMLGEDWQPWAKRYCCGIDSARISMTRGPGMWDVTDGNFVSAATGAALAYDRHAQVFNAWPCLDWVNGECDGLISRLDP